MDLMYLAETLVKTGFLPQAVKTPAQAVAIILTGRELGIGPMQSLRSVGIINGKPVLAADLQLGVVHRAGGGSRFLELTPAGAKLELSAPWLIAPHHETFTMEDAKRANLIKNAVWINYPKAMLRSLAITAALRSVGFEPCAGVYDPEELGGEPVVVTGVAVEPTAPEPSTPGVDLEQRMKLSVLVKRHRAVFPKEDDAALKAWLDAPGRSYVEVEQKI